MAHRPVRVLSKAPSDNTAFRLATCPLCTFMYILPEMPWHLYGKVHLNERRLSCSQAASSHCFGINPYKGYAASQSVFILRSACRAASLPPQLFLLEFFFSPLFATPGLGGGP